jgi:hypothetical protein
MVKEENVLLQKQLMEITQNVIGQQETIKAKNLQL